jgi:hypothetical protein
MKFIPSTAFEIPRNSKGLIANDKDSLNEFWTKVEDEQQDGVSGAIGCYLFSVRAGKGALPWYVGLAVKQSFRKECFTSHKLVHYNNVIAGRRGTPMLTLVPKFTPGGKIVGPTGSSHRDIEFLEILLIANCLNRNSELCNKKDTKLLRDMKIYGMLNTPQGKQAASVNDFRVLVGA